MLRYISAPEQECFKRRQKLPDIFSEVGLAIIKGLV